MWLDYISSDQVYVDDTQPFLPFVIVKVELEEMRWVMAISDDQRHKLTVVLQELKKQFATDAGQGPTAEDQEANAITTISLSKKPTPTVRVHRSLVIKKIED